MANSRKKGIPSNAASSRPARDPGLKPEPKKKGIPKAKKTRAGPSTTTIIKTDTAHGAPVKKRRRRKMSVAQQMRKQREVRKAKNAVDDNEGDEEDDLPPPKGAPKPETIHNSELGSDGLEWEAEKVVKSRMTATGDREYFVKWKGWPSKNNTWEPAVNLVNSFELITDFDEANPNAP